jgi:hypothetical protein
LGGCTQRSLTQLAFAAFTLATRPRMPPLLLEVWALGSLYDVKELVLTMYT